MASCSLNSNDKEPTKCVPCSSLDKSALFTQARIEEELQSLPLWTLQEQQGDGTLYISRKFVAKNFQCALDSLNEMGVIAEREGHHPDFHLTSYRNVQVDMYTHKVKGVTQNDIDMARMLDKVPVAYSPKWLKENPEAMQES